jgi:hypothetical protein
VSIAENLNFDYSDSNVSDIEDENNLAYGDVFEPETYNEINESNPMLDRIYEMIPLQCFILFVFSHKSFLILNYLFIGNKDLFLIIFKQFFSFSPPGLCL